MFYKLSNRNIYINVYSITYIDLDENAIYFNDNNFIDCICDEDIQNIINIKIKIIYIVKKTLKYIIILRINSDFLFNDRI